MISDRSYSSSYSDITSDLPVLSHNDGSVRESFVQVEMEELSLTPPSLEQPIVRRHKNSNGRNKERPISTIVRSSSGLHIDNCTQVEGRDLIGILPSTFGFLAQDGDVDDFAMLSELAGVESSETTTMASKVMTLRRIRTQPSLNNLRRMKSIKRESAGDISKLAAVDSAFDESVTKKNYKNEERAVEQLRGPPRWIARIKMFYKKEKNRRYDPNPIWRSSIHEIEGHMGTGIARLFVLMRWLFLLNLFLSFMWLCIVVIPQAAFGKGDLAFENNLNVTRPIFSGLDVLTGEGYLATTFMFYAGYDQYISEINYNMDLAYFICMASTFLISMVAIILTMRSKFTQNKDTTSLVKKDDLFPFGVALCGSWDHSISRKAAANVMSAGIANTLRELITADRLRMKDFSHQRRNRLLLIRCFTFCLTIALLVVSFYVMYLLIRLDIDTRASELDGKISELTVQGLSLLFATVISLINVFLPACFRIMSKYEDWGNFNFETKMNVARAYTVKIATVFTVIVSLWFVSEIRSEKDNLHLCYESFHNMMGTAIYKLILADAIVVALATVFVSYGEIFVLSKFYGRKNTKIDFDMPSNVLELSYRQALIWMGVSFAPLLPLFGAASIFFNFYVKKIIYMRTSKLPKNYFTAHRSSNFFLGILLFTEIIILIPVGYIFTSNNLALYCVHYRGGDYSSIISVISYYISISPGPLKILLEYITSMTFLFPLAMSLTLIIFWSFAALTRFKWRSQELEKQLSLERADKRYLLRLYGVHL